MVKGPRRCLGLVVMLWSTAACYTYQPLPSPEPEPGSRISVQLTETGSRSLWSQIGPNVLHVDGNVLGVDSAALSLSVQQVEDSRGMATTWNGERVTMSRNMIAGMQRRRFSTGGTVLLGGAAAAALYALYSLFGSGGLLQGNPGTGNPSPPQ